MNRIHFHSIDALRFFAFLKVYLLHVPIQGAFPIFGFLKSGGGIGVSFFFVLSGFLITYILATEKLLKDRINIKRFAIRRGLRIWPLFYLMVILAFILPYDFKQNIGLHMVGGGYEFDWRYSFTFLENYKMLIMDQSPKTTPMPVFWSLCIEEHFYIFWMISLSILPSKHTMKFLFSCILISWAARYIEPFIFNNSHINTIELFTNLDFFAVGGILGFLVARDYEKVSNYIQNISVSFKRIVLVSILLLVVFQKIILPIEAGTLFSVLRPTIIALLFAVVIAIFIPKESSIKIKSSILTYLGVRSYGLYVYHIIFIHVVFQYCIKNEILIDNWYTLSAFMAITMGGTIIVSILSYRYFEKPILALRNSQKLNRILDKN